MGTQGSNLGLPQTSCVPGGSHDCSLINGRPLAHISITGLGSLAALYWARPGFLSTYTGMGRNNLCPFFLLESCASVPGVCGKSALLTIESYFLSSPNVPLSDCVRACPGDRTEGSRGAEGRSPGRFWSFVSFHKQHPVASCSLFAEIHFQPRCSNCVLIWNYLCWLLASSWWKWGILHLVVNDFILYFPGERECGCKRSPLLVFQYLLYSCERFYLKKGIWAYCIKTSAFLYLQSNCGLNSLYPRELGLFRHWFVLWYKIAYAEGR